MLSVSFENDTVHRVYNIIPRKSFFVHYVYVFTYLFDYLVISYDLFKQMLLNNASQRINVKVNIQNREHRCI